MKFQLVGHHGVVRWPHTGPRCTTFDKPGVREGAKNSGWSGTVLHQRARGAPALVDRVDRAILPFMDPTQNTKTLVELLVGSGAVRMWKKHAAEAGADCSTYLPDQLLAPRELFRLPRDQVETLCRQRVNSTYIGNGQALSRVLARYKFLTEKGDNGFAPHIIMDGYWEFWLTSYVVETVEDGWTAIDIGANYGYYSVLMADLVGPNGRLIAFEPNPHAAKAAWNTISINGFASRSEVRVEAISEISGVAQFIIPEGEPKNAHLEHSAMPTDGISISVNTITLDEICLDLDRVDFIKIDAEGAEASIFLGMQRTIERFNPKVVMEFNAARPDAHSLAKSIFERYTVVRNLTENATVEDVTFERLMRENRGHDWLLILKN